MPVTDDIVALCSLLRARLNGIRAGEVVLRIQDGRVLLCRVTEEYRRGYEIKAADLVLDNDITVVYNTGDIGVNTG